MYSLDIEAEVVSVVSGAGLVLQLPGLSIRQPEVDLSVSELPTQPVAANLEELLGAVEGAGEEEPGEGEGERADVVSRQDDELALRARDCQQLAGGEVAEREGVFGGC